MTHETIVTNITNITIPEISTLLTQEELEILIKKFGNENGEIVIKTTKAEEKNGRLILRHELGTYWIEYSYDSDAENLDEMIETDRNKWLKDIARELLKTKPESIEIPDLITNYTIKPEVQEEG